MTKEIDKMILFCKKEINKIKAGKLQPNTFRQITNGERTIENVAACL